MTGISALIICFEEDPAVIGGAIRSLGDQDRPPDQIVVVDNSADSRHRSVVEALGADYVASGRNLGFPQAVNFGAKHCSGDYLFLLNPDAAASPDCLGLLEVALEERPRAAVAGAQVLLPDGCVNAGDNPIHISGVSWSGGYLGNPLAGPPRTTLAVSGASILIRSAAFRELGGFHPGLFMYFDDADLCWRARLAGREVLFCPEARVTHDYEFTKGDSKWRWLEEGRLSAVLTNYEARTLILLAPLLFMTEIATWAAAFRGGWVRKKAGSWITVWRNRRLLRSWRARVAQMRRVSDRELLPEFAPVVDTPLLDSRLNGILPGLQRSYARLVTRLA